MGDKKYPVVVGYSGSDRCAAVAIYGAKIADKMGEDLVLVFALEASRLGASPDLEREVAKVGEDAMDEMEKEISSQYPDLKIEKLLVRDIPVEAILFVASDRDAETIVVGHGGRGPIAGALLGSVTYEVVHRAEVPVLVVPEEYEDI